MIEKHMLSVKLEQTAFPGTPRRKDSTTLTPPPDTSKAAQAFKFKPPNTSDQSGFPPIFYFTSFKLVSTCQRNAYHVMSPSFDDVTIMSHMIFLWYLDKTTLRCVCDCVDFGDIAFEFVCDVRDEGIPGYRRSDRLRPYVPAAST